MSLIAKTPKPPYCAVIFTSLRTEGDNGYGAMAQKNGRGRARLRNVINQRS